jgi:hypothetical protein
MCNQTKAGSLHGAGCEGQHDDMQCHRNHDSATCLAEHYSRSIRGETSFCCPSATRLQAAQLFLLLMALCTTRVRPPTLLLCSRAPSLAGLDSGEPGRARPQHAAPERCRLISAGLDDIHNPCQRTCRISFMWLGSDFLHDTLLSS